MRKMSNINNHQDKNNAFKKKKQDKNNCINTNICWLLKLNLN